MRPPPKVDNFMNEINQAANLQCNNPELKEAYLNTNSKKEALGRFI